MRMLNRPAPLCVIGPGCSVSGAIALAAVAIVAIVRTEGPKALIVEEGALTLISAREARSAQADELAGIYTSAAAPWDIESDLREHFRQLERAV